MGEYVLHRIYVVHITSVHVSETMYYIEHM